MSGEKGLINTAIVLGHFGHFRTSAVLGRFVFTWNNAETKFSNCEEESFFLFLMGVLTPLLKQFIGKHWVFLCFCGEEDWP